MPHSPTALRRLPTLLTLTLVSGLLLAHPAAAAATTAPGGGTATRTFIAADDSDQTKTDEDAAAIELVHPDDLRGSLTLPTTGTNGSTISWVSSNPAVVANDGVVNRPAHGAGDITVTLTATRDHRLRHGRP